jgi:hypothetical protein
MHLTATAHVHALRMIDHHEEFSKLAIPAQHRVLEKLDWVDRIAKAGHGAKDGIVQLAAADLGVSPGAVRRYCQRFREAGWRGLKDTRIQGAGSAGKPQAFKDFVAALHLQNQRATTGREVQRQLVERWRKWRMTGDPQWAIPGYTTPPAAGPKGYPVGWSEDQITALRPDAHALATARQGGKSAADYLPSILKTRYGTRFGQVVFFDDQDYDNKVVAPGLSQKALRPQGFNSIDYLSGCFLDYSIRLRWWDMEKGQYKTLTGIEATWFLISHLQKHGYRRDADGTTLVVEHGTMNGFDNADLLTPDGHRSLASAILAVTDGHVRTARSGLFNTPVFAGMLFRPQSSGNPNFKSPVEGMFNLVRNRHAALPGATGRNRDLKPAEQYGQDIYIAQLLKVWERLDDQHRQVMRFPIATAAQFGSAAIAMYQAINSRRDHALEGWARCGFVTPLFRWTPDERSPWIGQQELARLTDGNPALAAAVDGLMTQEGHVMPVQLAPVEVADQYRRELTRLADHLIPLLIPVAWARRVEVTSERTIRIKDQMLGPDAMIYIARTENRDGAFVLKPGTKVLAYLNPFLPEKLIVCREDGSFLGTIHQQTRAGWADTEAITAQLGMRAEIKADLDSAVRPHLAGLIEDRTEMKRTNDRLAAGQPVLPDEIAAARVAAGQKGHRSAAANRMQSRGQAVDYDAMPDPRGHATTTSDPLAGLADEEDLPDSL